MHVIPDFPGQYYGKSPVPLYTMGSGLVIRSVYASKGVKILVDSSTYGSPPAYTIGACYFYYGNRTQKGIVEAFTYHPGEQTVGITGDPDSYKLASFLYGNKFIHISSQDAGAMHYNFVTPSTIAKNGTAPAPGGDLASVKIAIRAVGDRIRPVNLVQVNDELMSYISSISGTYKDDFGSPRNPNSIIINPNGSANLLWNISSINKSEFWNVTFTITSYLAGNKLYINTYGRSNMTYMTPHALLMRSSFIPLTIKVIDYSIVNEFKFLAFFFIIGIYLVVLKR
jgi:hypothetical protein